MKFHPVHACVLASLGLSAALASPVPQLSPAQVKSIRGYLAKQACPCPEIDAVNYGNREAAPTSPLLYYGGIPDPLVKVAGVSVIGHLPDRDADGISSRFLSAGLELGARTVPDDELVARLKAAGIKRVRLNFAWRVMEKEKGVYDFSSTDGLVDKFVAAGIEPWLYGGYGNPIYYGEVKKLNKLASTFWDAPTYHGEEAVKAWLAFLESLARHYRGRVKLYEIWNELDARWYCQGEVAHKKLGVGVAARDYTDFFHRSALVLKAVDPEIRAGVSLGGLHSGWLFGLSRAGFGKDLDLWTYHGYQRAPEEGVRDSLSRVAALLKGADGSPIPFAMGESGRGAGPALTARLSTRTEYGQARFVARRLLFDRSMGAEFANLFNVASKGYGIFKLENGQPRLAYYVLRSMATLLDGLEPARDLDLTFRPRSQGAMVPMAPYFAIERHAFRRKGVPFYAWWNPTHLDIEEPDLFGSVLARSGCEKSDNLPHPIIIDPIRRTVYDVKTTCWAGTPGEDLLYQVPATTYPYILTDLSIFSEYVPDSVK